MGKLIPVGLLCLGYGDMRTVFLPHFLTEQSELLYYSQQELQSPERRVNSTAILSPASKPAECPMTEPGMF